MIATQASMKDAEGITTVLLISGTAGAADTALGPPPTGEIWEILAAWGIHDSAAGKACAWLQSDGVTTDQAQGAKTMTSLLPLSVYSNDANVSVLGTGDWKQPIRLTHTNSLIYRVSAIGGGEHGFIKTTIRKFRGVEAWGNL